MNKKRLSDFYTAYICKAIAVLIRSGVSAGDSLHLLSRDEKGEMSSLLSNMGRSLDEGGSLYEAFEETGLFSSYVTGMIKAGEETGKLEEALMALSDYYENKERLEKSIKDMLTYPMILMIIMAAVVLVLLIKVMPVFNEVYLSVGSSLSGAAAVLLGLGEALGSVIPLVALIFAAVSIFIIAFVINDSFRGSIIKRWSRSRADKGVLSKLNDARIASVIAMGLSSGLSMEESMVLSAQLMKDVPEAEKRCRGCAEDMAEGKDITASMQEHSIMPPYAIRLMDIGLKSGNADEMADSVAKRLAEEAMRDIGSKTAVIEPAMVIVLSVIVGFILLSVMIPLMNIMTAIG